MKQKSIALLQKIDSAVEQILTRFQGIFEVSVVQEKSTELSSVDSLAIESYAMSIIRLCEELLSISRTLKEAWCLESLTLENKGAHSEERDIEEVYTKFNKLTNIIACVNEEA